MPGLRAEAQRNWLSTNSPTALRCMVLPVISPKWRALPRVQSVMKKAPES